MRFGVPVFRDRIAPRCTIADGVLVVSFDYSKITDKEFVTLESRTWMDLVTVLENSRVDTLICGGIARDEKAYLMENDFDIVENVACTTDEILEALESGNLRPGLGFHPAETEEETAPGRKRRPVVDCLACTDRVCLNGGRCAFDPNGSAFAGDERESAILESARDIAWEKERNLCRLSELIYFCIDRGYRRLGLAYCTDLLESSRILVGILRRFFDVVPVCCKIGGHTAAAAGGRAGAAREAVESEAVACNPRGQAEALRRAGTEFNIAVGLCVGVDCLFAEASAAPVSTLFVKDRSLAHNPIGALYSEYYRKEVIQTQRGRNPAPPDHPARRAPGPENRTERSQLS